MKKMNLTRLFLFLFLALSAKTVTAQSQCYDYSDLWNSTYEYDGLRLGAGNKMFIGGRNSQSPIAWCAYPSTDASHSSHFYYSNGSNALCAAQIIYEPWGQRMRFQYSTNHNSAQPGDAVAWADAISFGNDGHVGINTLNTGCFNLAVEGSIGCRSLKVLTLSTWCDYVFDKDYKLMPLMHLDEYIKNNHHLPDMPTTAEVKKDGVDIGEVEAKLLKKVEELTLYVIDLKKENDAMKVENAGIKDQIKTLQSQQK